jgi:WD40 repeat protein
MNKNISKRKTILIKISKGGTRVYHSFARRFTTPSFAFLIFTIILSATVFFLSIRSGVPKFVLPALVELTSTNAKSLKIIHQIENGVTITSVVFSPDGAYLAVTRLDDILHVWSTEDYHLIYTFQTESVCGGCVAFSPDSHFMAAIRDGRPYDVILWNLDTGKSIWESERAPINAGENISSLAFSPDGQLLVGAIENRVLFWRVNITGCELIREIIGHTNLVESLAFNTDGQRLLTTSDDKSAKVWDVATGDLLMTLDGHTGIVSKGIYSPDGVWIVTAGNDGTIRFWDSRTGLLANTLTDHTSPVITLAYSPNGKIIASGGLYERYILWDGLTRNLLLTIKEQPMGMTPITFSPDSKIFITTSVDGTLNLWGVMK